MASLQDRIEMAIKSTFDSKGFDEAEKRTKKLKDDTKDASKSAKDFGTSLGAGLKTAAVGVLARGISKLATEIPRLTKKSADYIETLNVLEVAFDGNSESIRKFTSNIADTLNLDDATLIKTAASFKTLANSMGYASELGSKFSRMMTQLSTDVASLYNTDIKDAASMIQYAVQGQGKTLKAKTGASVNETTVQLVLDTIGVDATVTKMNDYEKALARTIAITYEMQNAEGDLARTIEAPANQMRVMGEQLTQLARNIGNVFLPAVAAVLPYLNGVLLVLNRIISSLASLVGFREDAWNNYEDKSKSLKDAFDDLGASVGGVGSEAEKTNKKLMGLRGFDKLNVIKTPTKSSGSGGSGGTAINPKLLDAFNKLYDNYDSMLDGVETKATKIANAIMKALGQIDFSNLISAGERLWNAFKPFAENVGKGLLWTFENVLVPIGKWTIEDVIPTFLDMLADGFTILNNAIEVFKPAGKWLWEEFLSPVAKWAGGTIVNTLKDLEGVLKAIAKNKLLSAVLTGGVVFATVAKNIGKLTTALGATKLGGAISRLISPMTKLFNKVKDGTKIYGNLNDGINEGIKSWRIEQGILDKKTGKFNGLKGAINGAKTATENLIIAAVGLETFKSSLDDMAESGWNLGNGLGAAAGAFATLSGSITAGAVFGPMGAAIGGVVGGITLLNESLDALFDHLAEKNKTSIDLVNEQRDAIQKQNEKALDNIAYVQVQTDRAKELSLELGNYVDENGKVTGSVDEVNAILDELNGLLGTEYKVTGDTITQNGKKIQSLKGIQDEIDKYIKKMKLQIVQEQIQQLYKDALNKQIEAMKKRNEAADVINELTEKAIKNNGILEGDEKRRLDKAKTDYANLSASIDGYQKNMDNYSKATNEVVKGNYDTAVEYLTKTEKGVYKSFDDLMKDADKTTDKTTKTIAEKIKKLDGTKIKIKGTVEVDDSGLQKLKNQISKEKVTFKSSTGATIVGNLQLTRKALGGIFSGGQWHDIAKYATGGLPNSGQLFVAREAGPELVGKIGSNTAVMNNNQIVSSVASGVYNAVKSAMNSTSGGVYNIYLDENHKLGTYTLEQLKGMAKSNGKPIRIGG